MIITAKHLATAPKRLRGLTVRGLAKADNAIDPTGGNFGAGIIRGFAVITRGEALGHGFWIDTKFVRQTRMALNALAKGAKSRFTHPGLSADGMGKMLGRAYRAKDDGDIVRSDLHLSKSAHRTPDGNLAEYVLNLAQEDPEAFGASIVFDPDREAERDFFEKHGGKFVQDPYYGEIPDFSEYQSPDPLNVKNLPHARLKGLQAVDIVDEPAANPSGMFGRDPIFAEAEQLMLHVAGLKPRAPRLQSLSIDPQRVTYFFTHFLERHGLALVPKEQAAMSVKTPKASKAEGGAGDDTQNQPVTYSAEQIQQYTEAFGAKGPELLLSGKSFEECQLSHLQSQVESLTKQIADGETKHSEQLAAITKERDELQTKLAAAATNLGEKEPVSFSAPDVPPKTPAKSTGLGENLSKVAAAMKFKS